MAEANLFSRIKKIKSLLQNGAIHLASAKGKNYSF